MAATWEFTYVDLYLGRGDIDAVDGAMRVIAELGKAGWEPVGEIRFDYTPLGSSRHTSVRELMFKRTLSAD
jgi:hypothetical protein